LHITTIDTDNGVALAFAAREDESLTARLLLPASLEFLVGGGGSSLVETVRQAYDSTCADGESLVGTALISFGGWSYLLEDRWTASADGASVDRKLSVAERGAGNPAVRLTLEATLDASGATFDDMTFFAPPALYDMNDIDGDGVEDYVDSRELVYRDDRLTGLAVLAYIPSSKAGVALTRQDIPTFDDRPERAPGQQDFVQKTDIGSLGIAPNAQNLTTLLAVHPFVERSRSHALTSEGREPWGAFLPVGHGTDHILTTTYALQVVPGQTDIESLWNLWNARVEHLKPKAVELSASLEEITRLRVRALLPYYAELETGSITAAGFVTNCHPQDGKQLGNIIQYGFTGQNVLNALHVLGHLEDLDDSQAREKALRVVSFFVEQALRSDHGLTHTLFDLDSGREAAWWSGLLLPLAYAEEGADLENLMGTVYEHMKYAIEPLRGLDGTYLRCMAEEHTALLRVYEAEKERGHDHPEWLEAAARFGNFLLEAQEGDGSWRRAYGFGGEPVIEPRAWFGLTELNQKSSTATAVPVLTGLYRVTGDEKWLGAAKAAEEFTSAHFVRDLKFNGGIHDSIYARAQLVDSESILFSLRASLTVWQQTDSERARQSAVDAARVLATWVYLWDVPLPPDSTLAGFGFRSTGWSACDTAGAGYIHPYELHAVPDLFEAALAGNDRTLALVADLVLQGSSETVATPQKDWGYAMDGLQEEGLLVSWWLIDDPMFVGTHFGGRGKGEGNKTCLPWISAVGIDAYDEIVRRYGTSDLNAHWQRAAKQ
jgi:hypothetical protein